MLGSDWIGLHTGDVIILGLIIAVAATVLGFVADAMMGDRGFGPFGNGFLVVLGGAVGVHYRKVVFGPLLSHDAFAIAISGACMAAAVLLTAGLVKSRMQQ